MVRCPNCGIENPRDASECVECGEPLPTGTERAQEWLSEKSKAFRRPDPFASRRHREWLRQARGIVMENFLNKNPRIKYDLNRGLEAHPERTKEVWDRVWDKLREEKKSKQLLRWIERDVMYEQREDLRNNIKADEDRELQAFRKVVSEAKAFTDIQKQTKILNQSDFHERIEERNQVYNEVGRIIMQEKKREWLPDYRTTVADKRVTIFGIKTFQPKPYTRTFTREYTRQTPEGPVTTPRTVTCRVEPKTKPRLITVTWRKL